MESSRREILKIFGISALALSTLPILDAFTAEQAESGAESEPTTKRGANALTAGQWAMVIDTRKFKSSQDIAPLVAACHKIHNVPHLVNKRHEIKWIWETEYKHAFPMKSSGFMDAQLAQTPILVLCNHCGNPPCVRACPTQATFKRATDGIVMMDFHRCIGCRFCMAACPFGARSFNFRDPRPFIVARNDKFPTRTKGVVEKCNFCAERLAVGQMPACVEASEGKMIFGDLYDPQSEVREMIKTNYTIRRKQALGTEPSVYYIV
jgi:Fe-S-cluster-containing dehydrogenase component